METTIVRIIGIVLFAMVAIVPVAVCSSSGAQADMVTKAK
jgi:hypothetical protein